MDESRIEQLSGGYRASQVLFTACRFDLFEFLDSRPAAIEEIRLHLKADRRGIRILLDCLASLGFLEKEGDLYRNTRAARDFLLRRSPNSKYFQMLHNARLYDRWAGLADAVLTGRPVAEDKIDVRLPGGRRDFARAMADSARAAAKTTAWALDLSEVRTLLDVGGGPAVYATELARRNDRLRITLMDDDETLEVAAERVRAENLEDRIRLLPGDAFRDDLGGPYDFIFVSNLIHIYGEEANVRLIRRCAAALSAGGRLGIKDFFVDLDGTDLAWNRLFAVNMLVASEGGDCYTVETVERWCASGGLAPVQRIPLTPRTTLLIARTPK
jgi:3-hydroxy-5-methyl-1-naphthoate 3-O-methyltransferase